jgi:hypothetical protein
LSGRRAHPLNMGGATAVRSLIAYPTAIVTEGLYYAWRTSQNASSQDYENTASGRSRRSGPWGGAFSPMGIIFPAPRRSGESLGGRERRAAPAKGRKARPGTKRKTRGDESRMKFGLVGQKNGYELPRILLPRRWANKASERERPTKTHRRLFAVRSNKAVGRAKGK